MPIYTYQQLKGKIKVGDTVINEGGKKKVTEVYNDGFRLEGDTPLRFFDWHKLSLELLEEKTIDTVDVGDVLEIVGKHGVEYTIEDKAQNGVVLFVSSSQSQYTFPATRKYLKAYGYTVKQSPQPVIMTREEAEKELSKDGKQVKIV